jgi:hypothetical protein
MSIVMKRVMDRAWKDFKFKKKSGAYEGWTFKQSLHYAHKIKSILN